MFEEEIKVVQENPLVLILTLSDGINQGRWQAAENFGEIITEVKKRYPDKQFQYIPFNYAQTKQGPALEAIMAIA